MADAGSFNADLGINITVDDSGLTELVKSIKEISKGKDLQRYWKDVESATDSARKSVERYSKNINSNRLAEEFLKQINALKALTGKDNIKDLFPDMEIDFDSLTESAKKIVPKINAEFSTNSFSQVFQTFEMLKSRGIELEDIFRKLSNYNSISSRNFELERKNFELENLIGDSDAEKIKNSLREIQKLRQEAEDTFSNFLTANNIEKTDYYGDEKFNDYFESIRNGSMSAKEAITTFKTEYAYLLEESFKSNGNSFGIEQIQLFAEKLNTIFLKVEETSNKISEILTNGIVSKLSLDNANIINTEQFSRLESIFENIELHLSSMKAVFVDVGDGEEFSPLLSTISKVESAIKELNATASNIKLNFNMDLGDEVSERLNQKVSQASARQLEAYRNMFSAMKRTGKTNMEMLKFYEPEDASTSDLVGIYKGMISRAKIQFKSGRSNVYKQKLGKEWDDLEREVTNANKQLSRADSKRSENGILNDLFGQSDLSGVIEQLELILVKLDEISSSALQFSEVFKNGLNVTASVEEIDKLTNRVKELETELEKIKTGTLGDVSTDLKDTFQGKKDKTDTSDIDAQIQKNKELNKAIEDYEKIKIRITQGKAFASDEQDAENLFNTINKIMGKADGSATILSQEQLDAGQKKLDEIDKTISNIQAKSKEDFIKSNEKQIKRLESQLKARQSKPIPENQSESYKAQTSKFDAEINEYKEAINELKESGELTEENKKNIEGLRQACTDTAEAFKQMSAAQKGSTENSRWKEIQKLSKYIDDNTRLSKEAKQQLKLYLDMLKSGDASVDVGKIHTEWLKVAEQERIAGREGKSFIDTIKEKTWYSWAGQIASMFSAYDLFNWVKQGVSVIRELDSAMVEVKKVSDETEASYANFSKTIASTAKEIASTNKDLLNSSADYLRLGYNLDQSSELAKNTGLFVNVGDGIDIESATEDMITAMKAFDIQAEDSIKIVDSYNEIGNTYAVSASGIGEAMKRSASALETANNTFEESIGLITAMDEIIQDDEVTGTTLKVLSLRLRGASADLESMGESTDGLCDSTSKLREKILALTGVDIMVDDHTFKSTAQQIKELGAVWDSLSDTSQAATLEIIAGKSRANGVKALLKNYQQIDAVISDLDNAEGSALKENAAIIDSIDGRMKVLSATAEEFWQNFINTDLVKTAITSVTTLLDLLTQLIDKVGSLPLLGVGAGLFKVFNKENLDLLLNWSLHTQGRNENGVAYKRVLLRFKKESKVVMTFEYCIQ